MARRAQNAPTDADALKVYVRTLTKNDIDAIISLEEGAFENPEERAGKDKIFYRLTVCPEVALGIFTTTNPTEGQARKEVLLGHIIGTKINADWVTDRSMKGDNYGHVDTGKTIAVHQMAIHKDYHRKGLGKILLKEFMQRMKQSGIAKRLVLIARDNNVKFYEKVGFDERGESNTKIAGGGWKNMYGYM
ncbi:acyl-CoA N-acyltransferase [Ascobolus immersus RN42]|uniref:Acyl-CoA N-acyltransferase n=1 Tax=Ascobolus immersus RN42 TaxID=1160509 RepID=A0A3N4IBK7_ASCIM|nr:acyl-CoA N-acyltransferase [Ascobolus immersus RN42]